MTRKLAPALWLVLGLLAASWISTSRAGDYSTVPGGAIVMWSGTLASIPTGWQLCDGTGGTPDLRDKFAKCVAAAENPGATGGAATHSHGTGTYAVANHASHTHDYTQVLNHTHTVSVTDPGHTHTQTVNSASTGGLSGYTADTSTNNSTNSGYSTVSNTTGITASTQNPAGGVATGTTAGPSATLTHSLSGSSESVSSEPAYYKLAFIMRSQ